MFLQNLELLAWYYFTTSYKNIQIKIAIKIKICSCQIVRMLFPQARINNFHVQSSAKSFAIVSLKRQIDLAVGQLMQKYHNRDKIAILLDALHKKYISVEQKQPKQVQSQPKKDDSQSILDNGFENQVIEINNMCDESESSLQTKFIIYSRTYPLSFKSQIEEIQFYEKKIAAQTFIRWGHSYPIFKDEIRKRGGFYQVSENRFKKIANTYISDAYKKIEDFLEKICRYEVKRQFKLRGVEVYSVLFNCRRYFSKQGIITFLKFIGLLFQEQCISIEVTRNSVIQFYERSRQFIKQKQQKTQRASIDPQRIIKSRKGSSKTQKFVEAQSEQEKLIDIYMQVQRVSDTKDKYYKMYGYYEQFMSTKNVQNIIFKYVRKAIRTLQEYYRQHFMILPKMIDLNDMKIKQILTNPQATLLRILILKFSRIRELNISILADLINEINNFFKQKQKQEINIFQNDNGQTENSLDNNVDLE